jgi:hypothetical protein
MKLSEAILEYDLHLKTKAKSTRDLNLGTLHKLLAFVGDFELYSVTISQLRRWR